MTAHIFGGPDTATKLHCLRSYLQAFSIALKEKNFTSVYIDAFAGSGSRTEVRAGLPILGPGFPETEEITTPGSAKIAIDIKPPLSSIILIEQDPIRFAQLEALKQETADARIQLYHGDANNYVEQLCAMTHWRGPMAKGNGTRGVIFLDPYGMEVSWTTVQAIANTEALDCWYFFPLSGLYRNAPRDPKKLDAGKEAILDRVLGSTDWRERWYPKVVSRKDMFEEETEAVRRVDVDAIETYVKERLESVFKGVVLDPIRLHHRHGPPLASLFFAVSNPSPKAVGLAKNIANHILNSGRSSQRRPR